MRRRFCETGLREIAGANVGPSGGGGPGGPEIGAGAGVAAGETRPPLAISENAAREIRLAVAVEVADLHIHPGDIRTPLSP